VPTTRSDHDVSRIMMSSTVMAKTIIN
jgi:hypothetical protein